MCWETRQAIQRAEELSGKSSDRSVRLSVAITAASIRAARGDAAKSLKDLEKQAGGVRFEIDAASGLSPGLPVTYGSEPQVLANALDLPPARRKSTRGKRR